MYYLSYGKTRKLTAPRVDYIFTSIKNLNPMITEHRTLMVIWYQSKTLNYQSNLDVNTIERAQMNLGIPD